MLKFLKKAQPRPKVSQFYVINVFDFNFVALLIVQVQQSVRFRTASCTIVCHAKADHNSSCCLFFFRFVFFLLTEVLPVKKCVESKRPRSQRLKSACGARRIVWYLAVKQHQSARKHTYHVFQNACFNFFLHFVCAIFLPRSCWKGSL